MNLYYNNGSICKIWDPILKQRILATDWDLGCQMSSPRQTSLFGWNYNPTDQTVSHFYVCDLDVHARHRADLDRVLIQA
ncbi:hypothetical protein Hanom_Chr14g01282881 [Helianthus anomalus]